MNKKTVFSKSKSKLIFKVSQMPPLAHWDREGEFCWEKSEVCRWLLNQPEIYKWAFEKARTLGAIEYIDGKWIGVSHPLHPENKNDQSSLDSGSPALGIQSPPPDSE